MINLPSTVTICAMSRTGQLDVSDDDYVISINNTHTQHDVNPNIIIAMDDLQRDVKPHPDYVDSIVNRGCPVLSTRSFRKWPNVQPYPIKKVVETLERQINFPACKLLDNSICYAVALCVVENVAKVRLSGVDIVPHYEEQDLECAMVRWKHRGYGHAPDWFKYYHPDILVYRRPREPGWSSLHFLMGYGMARGMEFVWSDESTILDSDRENFFYGYTKQPRW